MMSESKVSTHEPSSKTVSALRDIGVVSRFVESREWSLVSSGGIWNIDDEMVLRTDITPTDVRVMMDHLKEPVVLLSQGDSISRTHGRRHSQKNLVGEGCWVLVPQPIGRMGWLPPGIFYAEHPKLLQDLIGLEDAVGGGFSVQMRPTKDIQSAFTAYLREKRPSQVGRILRSMSLIGKEKQLEERLTPDDIVGFGLNDLTPALLCHVNEIYAKHVPGADIKLIQQSSKLGVLQRAIEYDLAVGRMEPRYGSAFSKASKMRLVQIGKNLRYDQLHTFVFDANLESSEAEKAIDVVAVADDFSRSVDMLLREWNIAKKVQPIS